MGWALRPKQPLEDGTNLYQKPMPKQDKGGGIIPTGEGALFWPWERHGEVPFVASPLAVSRPSLAFNKRETRVWGVMEMWKGIWRNPLQPDHKYVIILL